ncbi:hypothetical protein BDV97DRAFT_18948 [Delphinella strobiligena]|nr:hypothetical protein BDV97DRAFT_18948 [Delphinella strobiligena]
MMSHPEKMDKATELAETIKALSVNTDPPKVATRAIMPSADSSVADSWDDEVADTFHQMPASISSTEARTRSRPPTSEGPYAPPPTPSSPSVYADHVNRPLRSHSPAMDSEKRPEKSTAVANRLIAGALGVRAPKRTEEQRKYDRAMKEQEIRRKNKEKEEEKRRQEEAEKAKAAIWDD